MNKKAILQETLQQLLPHRDLAEGFLVIINSQDITDEILDNFITILSESIKTVEDNTTRENLLKAKNQLKDIQLLEEKQRKQEE